MVARKRVVGRLIVFVLEHFVTGHALQVELVLALLGGDLVLAEGGATLTGRWGMRPQTTGYQRAGDHLLLHLTGWLGQRRYATVILLMFTRR